MGVILAFDIVAPRERWLVQWAGRDATVKSAEALGAAWPQPKSPVPQSIIESVTVTRCKFLLAQMGDGDSRESAVDWRD
jgi:hypothetical protein